MSEFAIEIRNLSKKYKIGKAKSGSLRETLAGWFSGKSGNSETSDFWALENVSFNVERGEAIGIIGKNGAGKSTLLKILSRISEPTYGEIILNGRVSSLLEVGTGFHPELTGKENIYLNGTILGMRRSEIRNKFDEIVEFSGVEKFVETPVKHFSSGMKVRLAFSVAAHLEPEILIVDEVLAVGDDDFQKKCLGKMEDVTNQGRTVLFVSHNLTAINSLCNKGVIIERGKLLMHGDIKSAISTYINIHPGNLVEPIGEVVKRLELETRDNHLVIKCEYDFGFLVDYPLFGFSISDQFGQVITGTNQLKSGLKIEKKEYREGIITVVINSPILSNGRYWLSVWLGDLTKNFSVLKKCLMFEINSSYRALQRNADVDGSVIPQCEWKID